MLESIPSSPYLYRSSWSVPWCSFCLEKSFRVQVPLMCVNTALVTQGLRIYEGNASESIEEMFTNTICKKISARGLPEVSPTPAFHWFLVLFSKGNARF